MSSTSTSQPGSGYASPAHPSSTASSSKLKTKAANVFSNDGSFLQRFQHLKKDEEEKKKQEDTMAKKRAFDNRFKNRGKRPAPDESDSSPSTATTENPSKKPKADSNLTKYEKEMKNFAGRSLKDDGIGVRPLVK